MSRVFVISTTVDGKAMKSKLRAAVLFLGGGLVAVAFLGIPLRTGNSGPVASENGDVNGDGVIDVSDAVYTLLHLFKNGPAPVAIGDPPELISRVEALEQMVQNLASRPQREMDCEYRADRFRFLGNGEWLDQCTGKVWGRESEGTWDNAITRTSPDPDGWRLPTLSDASSVYFSRNSTMDGRSHHRAFPFSNFWVVEEYSDTQAFMFAGRVEYKNSRRSIVSVRDL